MPLIVPIILILINTIASALGKTAGIMQVLIFLGQPIVAVGLGLLVAIFTLGRNLDRQTCISEMEKGMMSAGIIMLVTGIACGVIAIINGAKVLKRKSDIIF